VKEIFRIEFSSSPRLLRVVRAAVGQVGGLAGLDEDETRRLVTAVDEACANAIRHSYGGDPGQRLILILTLRDDRLDIELRDFGKKPDPARVAPAAADTSRPGGLGLPLIRDVMDEVEFDLSAAQGTILRLAKRLRRPG
jgi:anti-sigma regulatory factor (Ser/Thr protein kinase)